MSYSLRQTKARQEAAVKRLTTKVLQDSNYNPARTKSLTVMQPSPRRVIHPPPGLLEDIHSVGKSDNSEYIRHLF